MSSVGFESNPRPQGLFGECSWSSGAVGALIPCIWSAVPWLPKVPLGVFLNSTNIPLLFPRLQLI